MIETVKVSSKGQIVLPERIRNDLKIREGDKLIIIEKQRKLVIELEEDFLEGLKKAEQEKEKLGWLALAEKNLADLWENPRDEKAWGRYL